MNPYLRALCQTRTDNLCIGLYRGIEPREKFSPTLYSLDFYRVYSRGQVHCSPNWANGAFTSSAGWIRTIDLNLMRVSSYHCSTAEWLVEPKRIELFKHRRCKRPSPALEHVTPYSACGEFRNPDLWINSPLLCLWATQAYKLRNPDYLSQTSGFFIYLISMNFSQQMSDNESNIRCCIRGHIIIERTEHLVLNS